MTLFTRRFIFLWTCLLTSICAVFATSNPILTNPSACNLGLYITEAGCGPANEFQVDVTSAPGTILGTDVYLKELRLVILHDWLADLDIYLKSPSGVIVEISTDNGDVYSNYGNPNDATCSQYTTFRAHTSLGACALANVKDGSAPFIGSYLPEGNFSDFNDGSSPLGQWTLIVCDDGAGNLGYLEFVELVFESTTCLPPTQVTVLESDSTTAKLSWVTGTTCSDVIFEFGPVGFVPGSDSLAGSGGTVLTGTCPMYQVSGLAPNSKYEIYLREKCGSGNYSINSCPVLVTTSCSPPPATIVEDFNNQALCNPVCGATCPIVGPWRNGSYDSFDWLVNTDSTITENTGPAHDNPGGGNYVYLEASGSACTNGKRAVLISNCIQVVANPDSCDMSFDYHFFGVHMGGMSFEVSVNGGTTWTTLWNEGGNKGNKWRRKFIDLDAYDGMTAQFRFVGRGGNGKFADLALDNIAFYGSIDLGFPDYVYFLDADGDGYGNPNLFIASCQPASFPNYVNDGTDCDDQDFFLNPGETEILCDDVDSNCNGFDDEYFVTPVTTVSSVICSGANGFVAAQPVNFGEISWFETPTGGNPVAVGDTLFPDPSQLVNHGLDTLVLVYYAEENTVAGCISNARTEATITILPSPKLVTTDTPGNCSGQTFDLSTINITDESGLNGDLLFYDNLPLIPGDEVGPLVLPTATTNYYVVSEATNGCRDTLTVTYTVQPGPIAHIPDSPTLCRNSTKQISVVNLGTGTPPFQYSWNTNDQTETISIFSDNNLGTVNTYAVTITDANGCTSADTLNVTTIDNISQIVTSSTPVTTCDGNDGSISLTPLDGTAPFTYEWVGTTIPNQPGGLTLTGLEQGSYAFTVTDSSPEQCQVVVPVVVVNGPAASVEVDNVQHVSCHGSNDGCITLDVIGGPNTTINWSNGMTGASICGLAANTYTATVSEGNCHNIVTIPIDQPEGLLVNLEIDQVSCFGGNDGQIRATVFGGTPPLTYHWSNSSTDESISDLSAGFYSLTVEDDNGCQVIQPQITVAQPSQISLVSLGFQQPTCFGQSNGSISVEAGGGVPPYSYSWNNGGSGTTLLNIAAGAYTVHIRDENACVLNQVINLTQPQPLVIAATEVHPPDCAGQNSGYINTVVTGGNGSYQFAWSNGATSQNLTAIGNGTYSVTVTDDFGCKSSAAFGPIASPEVMSAGINQAAPFCIGRDENCLEAYVTSGGQPPFSFNWSTDDSGPELCALSYGDYVVTITDANGCESIQTTTIDSLQVLTIGFEAFPPLCHGQTGQLAITVAGGTEPYSVVWSDGQTGNVASNLLAQNHAATVTDATGCANALDIIPLLEPEQLSVQLENIEHIACFNDNEGSIDITVSGGVLPYHFQWTNGATTEDVTGLYEGNYSATITDNNGCTAIIENLYVDAPERLQPSSSLGVPLNNCQSVLIEDVCVTVEGGEAPFFFAWDTGDTTECLLNPLPGDYHVTITDAAGCTIEFMSVKVPTQYTAVSAQQLPTGKEIICFGTMTGQLNVLIQGGVGPYQYNWSNSVHGQTTSQILLNSNLGVGQYSVTITDNTGCTAVASGMPISTFGAINPTIDGNQVEHIHCKGGSDGSIPLNVNGGLVPYIFYWENGSGDSIFNTQNISGLSAGSYFVTVTDQLGCTNQASTLLLEPATQFLLDSSLVQAVTCYGEANGSILALPQGGDLPYQYLWSNQAVEQGITNLTAGVYSVTVTDDNGCTQTNTFIVGGPDAPISVSVIDSAGVTCFGANDGFIEIAVSGGTPNYIFNWNAISGDQNLVNAIAGDYTLLIFDSLGCSFTTQYNLGSPPPLGLSVSSTPQTQLVPPNGTATANAFGGTPPLQYFWSGGLTGPSITDLPKGTYGVTVEDANGCEITDWVFVDFMSKTTDNQPVVSYLLFPNPTTGQVILQSASSALGVVDVEIFNQIGQLVLLNKAVPFQNGRLVFDLRHLPSGIYQLVVLGADGIIFEGKILVQR